MMHFKKFAFRFCVVALLLTMCFSTLNVGAVGVIKETGDVPYSTFTYWDGGNTSYAVSAKGMYNFEEYIAQEDLADGTVASLDDVCFDKNDNLYLLEGDASKIHIYDKDINYLRTVGAIVSADGEVFDYSGAESVFVSSRDLLYICDSDHERVIISDLNGVLHSVLYLPDSSLIPENIKTNYRPSAVTVDSSEYIYVLSDGSYYGAMLYTPEGQFLGFYGANTVETTVLDAFKSLWNSLFMSDAKREASERKIPFQFIDLYVDNADFVYTATGSTSWGVQIGQIKRMSPGGLNAINSNQVTFGLRYGASTFDRISFSNLSGVCVNDDNYIFTYDAVLGGIYIYNDDCVLLNAFSGGSKGDSDQIGIPNSYSGIDINSEDTIVLIDSGKCSVSVFKINDYGRLVLAADLATRNGEYEVAQPLWHEVLKNDRNSQIAYSGLARTYFAEGNYDKSMYYAKQGFDSRTYSAAFEYVRRNFLEKNINLIALVIVLFVIAIIVVRYIKKKKNITFIKNVELKLLTRVTLHPGDVFADVKHHQRGSALIGAILIVLYYVTAIVKETASGFLFRSHVTSSFNSFMVLAQTLGLVLLWTICNWGVCTLMGGKGKMKEIFVVTSYALVPLILSNVVYTVVSNFILADEVAFLSIFMTVMTLLTGFILITGMIKVHDYTFGEFVVTSILTLVGILIVIFLGVAVFILVQQAYSFIATVLRELIYR